MQTVVIVSQDFILPTHVASIALFRPFFPKLEGGGTGILPD